MIPHSIKQQFDQTNVLITGGLGFIGSNLAIALVKLGARVTILDSLMVLYENYNDSKYEPCPLLSKMVKEGLVGKKSGKGFYNYGI